MIKLTQFEDKMKGREKENIYERDYGTVKK